MEEIEMGDSITLDDNKEYFVSGKCIFDDIDYLSLVSVDDYSLKFAALVGKQVVLLDNKEDKDIIDELVPLFLQSIAKEYMELSKE
jgi:hypothetical protein